MALGEVVGVVSGWELVASDLISCAFLNLEASCEVGVVLGAGACVTAGAVVA